MESEILYGNFQTPSAEGRRMPIWQALPALPLPRFGDGPLAPFGPFGDGRAGTPGVVPPVS